MTEEERDEYIRYINDQYDLFIKKIAVEILKDENLVCDVKQQVLMKLMSKVEVLMELHQNQVMTYVGRTTERAALSEYNRQKTYRTCKETLKGFYGKHMTMEHVDFDAHYGKYGFSEEMWELLMELPQTDRDIMIYKYSYDLTVDEIADMIGANREMVKKRLQRGRHKLELLIEEKGVDFR